LTQVLSKLLPKKFNKLPKKSEALPATTVVIVADVATVAA